MNNSFEYHLITGLPRSGSTLLSALLLQNPRFHAGITSPVGGLVGNMIEQIGAGSELGQLITKEQRRRLIGGIFDSFYADKIGKGIIFDTNRMWSAHMALVKDLFPRSKVIACVRNVAWIMDSLERLYQSNPYEVTKLFNGAAERNTVFSRVETLAMSNRLVGYAWSALKEAFYGLHADSLLIVDYDLLVQAPQKVMHLIYQFLEEPEFQHDFNNLNFDAPEFDQALGLSGLHKVQRKVALNSRSTILPPDLFEKYSKLSFWEDQSQSRANVITIKNRH
jgi:sulfotransferase